MKNVQSSGVTAHGSKCHIWGQPGWEVSYSVEIKVFSSHIKVTSFIFLLTLVWHDYIWLHVIRQISNFNFILFSWHISEVVRELQEKSSQGSLAVLCVLFVKAKALFWYLFFTFIPGPCLPNVYLLWDWRDVSTSNPVHECWGFSQELFPGKSHNLSFKILRVISKKLKAQGLLSNEQHGWESLLHKYSVLNPVIVLGAQGYGRAHCKPSLLLWLSPLNSIFPEKQPPSNIMRCSPRNPNKIHTLQVGRKWNHVWQTKVWALHRHWETCRRYKMQVTGPVRISSLGIRGSSVSSVMSDLPQVSSKPPSWAEDLAGFGANWNFHMLSLLRGAPSQAASVDLVCQAHPGTGSHPQQHWDLSSVLAQGKTGGWY